MTQSPTADQRILLVGNTEVLNHTGMPLPEKVRGFIAAFKGARSIAVFGKRPFSWHCWRMMYEVNPFPSLMLGTWAVCPNCGFAKQVTFALSNGND